MLLSHICRWAPQVEPVLQLHGRCLDMSWRSKFCSSFMVTSLCCLEVQALLLLRSMEGRLHPLPSIPISYLFIQTSTSQRLIRGLHSHPALHDFMKTLCVKGCLKQVKALQGTLCEGIEDEHNDDNNMLQS